MNHETTCSADFKIVYLSCDPPRPLCSLFYVMNIGTHFLTSHILTKLHGLSRKYWINLAQICQNTYPTNYKTDKFLKNNLQHWDLKMFSIVSVGKLMLKPHKQTVDTRQTLEIAALIFQKHTQTP